MQNCMLNFACSSLAGRLWISALTFWRFTPTETFLTSAGLMSC